MAILDVAVWCAAGDGGYSGSGGDGGTDSFNDIACLPALNKALRHHNTSQLAMNTPLINYML